MNIRIRELPQVTWNPSQGCRCIRFLYVSYKWSHLTILIGPWVRGSGTRVCAPCLSFLPGVVGRQSAWGASFWLAIVIFQVDIFLSIMPVVIIVEPILASFSWRGFKESRTIKVPFLLVVHQHFWPHDLEWCELLKFRRWTSWSISSTLVVLLP